MNDRPCNYCIVQEIKKNKPKGAKVVLGRSYGGVDVYVVPKGEKLDTRKNLKTGNHLSKQFKIWCMELPNHCCC